MKQFLWHGFLWYCIFAGGYIILSQIGFAVESRKRKNDEEFKECMKKMETLDIPIDETLCDVASHRLGEPCPKCNSNGSLTA